MDSYYVSNGVLLQAALILDTVPKDAAYGTGSGSGYGDGTWSDISIKDESPKDEE